VLIVIQLIHTFKKYVSIKYAYAFVTHKF